MAYGTLMDFSMAALAANRISVLEVSQHTYPAQVTLRRNTSALLEAGASVDMICMLEEWAFGKELQPGLRVYGIPLAHRRSLLGYLFEYGGFFIWSFLVSSWLGLRRRYEVVQVDTLPDSLLFSVVVPRLRGARAILYVYDLLPEMVAARFRVGPDHPSVRVAKWLEARANRWAHHVITVSSVFRDRMGRRGLDVSKVTLVANSHPMDDLPSPPRAEPPVLVCQTSVIERYGVQVAIRALGELRTAWPELRLWVIGGGEYLPVVGQLAEELDLSERVVFTGGFLPWRQTMEMVGQASIGLVPIISDGYGELITPNKVLELSALGIPIVSSRLEGITTYFPPDSISYFEPGDHVEMAGRIDHLLRHPGEAHAQARRAMDAMQDLKWESASVSYLGAVYGQAEVGGPSSTSSPAMRRPSRPAAERAGSVPGHDSASGCRRSPKTS